ncbi:MAG: hypothetical protein E6J57_08370 [Deltaproteobacteria bacterium]|nr:MAG: hypothetical protein E6J57_08370 [Deltaproteobacteria bacterium]
MRTIGTWKTAGLTGSSYAGLGVSGSVKATAGSVTRADTKPPPVRVVVVVGVVVGVVVEVVVAPAWPWHTATPSRRQRSTMLFLQGRRRPPAVTHAAIRSWHSRRHFREPDAACAELAT